MLLLPKHLVKQTVSLVARTLEPDVTIAILHWYVIVRIPALSFCSTTSFLPWRFFPQGPLNNGRTFSTSTITCGSSYMAWYFNNEFLHPWSTIKSFCTIIVCSSKVTGPICGRTSVELHVFACSSWSHWTLHLLSSLGHDSVTVRVALSPSECWRELQKNKFVEND